MESPKGWMPLPNSGWRVVAHAWHYFNGHGSICGTWGQPQTPGGAPPKRNRWKDELTEKDRANICRKCDERMKLQGPASGAPTAALLSAVESTGAISPSPAVVASLPVQHYYGDSDGFWKQCKYCSAYVQLKIKGKDLDATIKHTDLCPVGALENVQAALLALQTEMEQKEEEVMSVCADETDREAIAHTEGYAQAHREFVTHLRQLLER